MRPELKGGTVVPGLNTDQGPVPAANRQNVSNPQALRWSKACAAMAQDQFIAETAVSVGVATAYRTR